MGLIRVALWLWLVGLAAGAEAWKGSHLPAPLALQTGSTYRYGHRLPGRTGYLCLGDYDRVTGTSWVWIFQKSRLWSQHLVEGDWDDSQFLDYHRLPGGGFALSRPGSVLSVLIFSANLRQEPRYFAFRAPDEASPWAVPEYRLNMRGSRLWVELLFDSPDGPGRGQPQFELLYDSNR